MINLLLLCVGVILATWFVGNALGFLLMLLVAGMVGFAAEGLIPGRPFYHGWAGAIAGQFTSRSCTDGGPVA
jgi:hypothetical protein